MDQNIDNLKKMDSKMDKTKLWTKIWTNTLPYVYYRAILIINGNFEFNINVYCFLLKECFECLKYHPLKIRNKIQV